MISIPWNTGSTEADMKTIRALVVTLIVISNVAMADSVTISDANASLKYTTDAPIYNLSLPNDPVQFPRTLEWMVDGRRILVYPSAPSNLLDVAHLHFDAHVSTNQMHAQGPCTTTEQVLSRGL
jgi:hypothetical protein